MLTNWLVATKKYQVCHFFFSCTERTLGKNDEVPIPWKTNTGRVSARRMDKLIICNIMKIEWHRCKTRTNGMMGTNFLL